MSSRNNSLQLKAEAKRMTDAESRGIDGKVYGKATIVIMFVSSLY